MTNLSVAEVVATEEPTQKTRAHPTVTGYDPEVRLYSSRYKQGGREVLSLDLSLAQIAGLIPPPDPKVPQPGNRKIQPAHAAAFAQYLRTTPNWVAPAIVLRSAVSFEFESLEEIEGAEFGVVSLPFLALGDIRILDGQHRILGIHMALKSIGTDIDKARSQLAKSRKVQDKEATDRATKQIVELMAQRRRFEVERASIQIFIEDEQQSYQQMFYDIADNALGITASVKARFDARKAVNRVLHDVMAHPLLEGRVDQESDRLSRTNPNFLSAKHVTDITRIVTVGLEGRISRKLEGELDEAALTAQAKEFLDLATAAFPQFGDLISGAITPADLRTKSMLGSPVTLRLLAGLYYELRNKRKMSKTKVSAFFSSLNKTLSVPASRELVRATNKDIFFVGAISPSARRQNLKELLEIMSGWVDTPPEWLTS